MCVLHLIQPSIDTYYMYVYVYLLNGYNAGFTLYLYIYSIYDNKAESFAQIYNSRKENNSQLADKQLIIFL